MNRVLVVKLGALGDILLAEGALRDIRAAHPAAHIAVLTRRAFAALLARCPWVDEVIVDDNAPRWRLGRMLALRRRLRAGRFERVYDLQNSRRTAFYFRWLLGGTEWSGGVRGCSHPHRHPQPKSLPVLERHAGQLRDAGIAVAHTPHPNPVWLCAPVDTLLRGAGVAPPFIVLLPGSSARHPRKRWPHYAALAQVLTARGLSVVTVPGPDEREIARGFAGVVLTAGARVLDLFELAGVLREAAFVVGNDSGPTHLAARLGAPGLALFGAGHADAGITSMASARFRTLTVPDLAALPAETVADAVLAAVSADQPRDGDASSAPA